MIFPEKIISIRPNDKVLEIGPGSSPHSRSNAFLELDFESEQDKLLQRGGVLEGGHFGNRPIYYYDGKHFPFEDGEFDYVICSHVIEHVIDPEYFLNEIFRVSNGRGYLEYPLITYEYLYNFNVHLHFVKFDNEERTLRYLPKKNTAFQEFYSVHTLFYNTLERGWDDLCTSNKKLFFEGFEFDSPFTTVMENNLSHMVPPRSSVVSKSTVRKIIDRITERIGW